MLVHASQSDALSLCWWLREGMWYGLAEWLDVAEDRIAEVVPNAGRFPDTMLYGRDELFN